MSKADLNVLQADSFVQKIVSEAVPKIVRVHSLFNPSRLAESFKKIAHIHRLNRLSEIHFRDTSKDSRVANAIDSDLFSFRHPQIQIQLGWGV